MRAKSGMLNLALALVALAFAAAPVAAQTVESIQLVGNFAGVSCEPEDPANDMLSLGDHLWRKGVFVNQPGNPDTVYFKFTKNRSYLPSHWGWSGTWGIAELTWSPPSIVAVLPDSGYHYFYFRDADGAYWIEQADASISGDLTVEGLPDVPPGSSVTLYDSLANVIGTFDTWSDDTYRFEHLCASAYRISAHAPGYRDTMINAIEVADGESRYIPIHLTPLVGVLIASADARRVDGGVMLTWCTMECGGAASFEVYRGYGPEYTACEKRSVSPVFSNRLYEFLDRCDDPSRDLYYWLVEANADDPSRFGPIFVRGEAAAAWLGQNYPNPFNPSTTIPFTVSAAGAGVSARIAFFDAAGRAVGSFDLGRLEAGSHAFRWNPLAERRGGVPSGVYYCRLTVGKETLTRKLILLR